MKTQLKFYQQGFRKRMIIAADTDGPEQNSITWVSSDKFTNPTPDQYETVEFSLVFRSYKGTSNLDGPIQMIHKPGCKTEKGIGI